MCSAFQGFLFPPFGIVLLWFFKYVFKLFSERIGVDFYFHSYPISDVPNNANRIPKKVN